MLVCSEDHKTYLTDTDDALSIETSSSLLPNNSLQKGGLKHLDRRQLHVLAQLHNSSASQLTTLLHIISVEAAHWDTRADAIEEGRPGSFPAGWQVI